MNYVLIIFVKFLKIYFDWTLEMAELQDPLNNRVFKECPLPYQSSLT